jgi:hypothetical protein
MCGGRAPGTIVDAFFFARCDGVYVRGDELRPRFLNRFADPVVHAVVRTDRGEMLLVLKIRESDPVDGFLLRVNDGAIVGVGGVCVPLAEVDLASLGEVLPLSVR